MTLLDTLKSLLSESDVHVRASLGDKHANTTDVYINGIRHEYRPHTHDAETFAKKINSIALYSHGRALSWLKRNSEFLGSDKPKKEKKSVTKPVQLDLFKKESGIAKLMNMNLEESDLKPHHQGKHDELVGKGYKLSGSHPEFPNIHMYTGSGSHDGHLVHVYKDARGKVFADHFKRNKSEEVK